MDPIVSHFEIFARALLDQLDVIVKAHLLDCTSFKEIFNTLLSCCRRFV